LNILYDGPAVVEVDEVVYNLSSYGSLCAMHDLGLDENYRTGVCTTPVADEDVMPRWCMRGVRTHAQPL
jgi:hypothetical protein